MLASVDESGGGAGFHELARRLCRPDDRLVTDKPERLSMKVLVALCDIFDCTPDDLITPDVVSARQPQAASGDRASATELPRELRPERARITGPDRVPPAPQAPPAQAFTGPGPAPGLRPLRALRARGPLGPRTPCLRPRPGGRKAPARTAGTPGARHQRCLASSACLRCSGLPLNQTCRSCGDETDLAKGQTCWRCLLTSMTRALLACLDGIIPAWRGAAGRRDLLDAAAQQRVTWLRTNPKTRELLHALGSGTVELTHEALDGLPASHTVEYLRGLLVTSHALPGGSLVSDLRAMAEGQAR